MTLLLAILGIGTAHAQTPIDLDTAASLLGKSSGQPVRLHSTRDFGREPFMAARSVLVDPAQAEALVESLRSRLGPGLIAFVGTDNSLADPPAMGSEVVVAKGADQFDILRVAASNAVNYDMATEDLIRKLKEWDAAYGIDIYMASTDTIAFRLKTLPPDLHAFAEEVYAFCPDTVDQGIGSVDALAEVIGRDRVVGLWWD
ncbi:DUF4253 domain-containing protein [Luteimonas aquatica]|uniref:DUF4253 domain-containing protein n=1 Tax=Luteimonas aquatica TaxID=450364 RepID=UPI001F5AF497|nr:DUF4253 domain-containing protein [Luteimonas aquatica]